MEIVTEAPFAARTLVWQGPGRQWNLTVVCKATYALAPGLCTVLDEGEPIHEADQRWSDGGDPDGAERSVWAPSDMAPFKLRAEVLVVGSAHAPPGEEVRSLVARVRVGSVDKSVEVVTARTVSSSDAIREGAPFGRMPLRFELAAGGPGTGNPVGVVAGSLDRHGRRTLPNLQPVGFDASAGEPPTVGLGPIAPEWPLRRDRLGPDKDAMLRPQDGGDWTTRPLPRGLDAMFFQSAPADQTLADLAPDTDIRLDGLHPEAAVLATRLERVEPVVRLEALGRPPSEVRLRADTLWIDTDHSVCTLTWRGHVHLDRRDQPGVVRVTCAQRERATPPAAPPATGAAARGPSVAPERGSIDFAFHHTETDASALAPDLARFDGALPFRRDPRVETIVMPPSAPAANVTFKVAPKTVGQKVAEAPQPPPRAPASEPEPKDGRASTRSGPLEIVWFDPSILQAIRSTEAWQPLVRDADVGPLDDEPTVADKRAKAERATIAAVLCRAPATGDLEECLLRSVSDDGAIEPPLVAVEGELEVQLDDVAALGIWVATAPVLAPGDKRLKEIVDLAAETQKTPLGAEPEVAASFIARLREAWLKAPKQVPAPYIDTHARRLLLAERKYQRRSFADAEWLRALLFMGEDERGVPAYLPVAAGRALPLVSRIPARVLAFVTPRQDDTEAAAVALRVSAIGRVIEPRRR